MKSMADIIREQRLALGLTQEELAEKLGLKKSAIAKYENGRVENIKRTTIQNMADVFGCKPSYLMGWSEDTESTTASQPKILTYYEQLNDLGQETATEQVRLLTLDKKYTAPPVQEFPTTVRDAPEDYLSVNAAQTRTDIPITEEDLDYDEELIREHERKSGL